MKAFVCVYLHNEPSKKAKTLTQAAAVTDPNLRQFLVDYSQPNAFWDWGDDPGFYSASRILDSPLKASWGVCRRDVRIQLKSGDFIVWFCARTDSNTKTVNYYFVGCTTVAETIDRITLCVTACNRSAPGAQSRPVSGSDYLQLAKQPSSHFLQLGLQSIRQARNPATPAHAFCNYPV